MTFIEKQKRKDSTLSTLERRRTTAFVNFGKYDIDIEKQKQIFFMKSERDDGSYSERVFVNISNSSHIILIMIKTFVYRLSALYITISGSAIKVTVYL